MGPLGIALFAVVMAIGLLGVLLPVLPGLLLIEGAAIAYGLVAGFGRVGTVAIVLITALLLVGSGAKLLLAHRRGSAAGAATSSLLLGALAGVVGFFVIPVIGLPLGFVAGLLVGEHQRSGDWQVAWRVTKQALLGYGIGVLVELASGVAMIGVWVWWVLVG